MREMLNQRGQIEPRERKDWLNRCADWKTRYPVVIEEHRKPQGPVSVYHLAEIFSNELESGDQLVSGSSGSAIELFLLAFKVKPKQRIYHTTALGAMGFGIAASIAVCLAKGRKPLTCIDGDGGFQFNIQELETVARLKLPIKFFILNNDGYSSIRASQTSFFGEPRLGCDARTGQSLPDVKRVAEAYGIATAMIPDQTDLREAIRRVLRMPGPVVCDVHVIADEVRQPRLASQQLPDGSFVSKPLEDLWPFLDRAEFDANMLVSQKEPKPI
jgi:acetolactate synthase-1/2/3 large subunit